MTDPESVIVSGPLTSDDLDDLLAVIRTVCDRHPEGHFVVTVDDPNRTMTQAEDAIRTFMPNGFIQRFPRPRRH